MKWCTERETQHKTRKEIILLTSNILKVISQSNAEITWSTKWEHKYQVIHRWSANRKWASKAKEKKSNSSSTPQSQRWALNESNSLTFSNPKFLGIDYKQCSPKSTSSSLYGQYVSQWYRSDYLKPTSFWEKRTDIRQGVSRHYQ